MGRKSLSRHPGVCPRTAIAPHPRTAHDAESEVKLGLHKPGDLVAPVVLISDQHSLLLSLLS